MDYLFPTAAYLAWTMAAISFVFLSITFWFLQREIITEGLIPSVVLPWKISFRFAQLLCSLMLSVLSLFIMYYVSGKANTEEPPRFVHYIFFVVYLSFLVCLMIWSIKRDRKKKADARKNQA